MWGRVFRAISSNFFSWSGVFSYDGGLRFFKRSTRDQETLTALCVDFGFYILMLPELSGPCVSAWALAGVSSVNASFYKPWISACRNLYSEIPITAWSQSQQYCWFFLFDFGFPFVYRIRSLWLNSSGSESQGTQGFLSPDLMSPFRIYAVSFLNPIFLIQEQRIALLALRSVHSSAGRHRVISIIRSQKNDEACLLPWD